MGSELSERTIPQEAGIVSRTVSFTKGCYTGQELVARIDSRGNRVPVRLCGVVLDKGSPSGSPGDLLMTAEREVGTLTSVGYSPRVGCTSSAGLRKTREVDPPAELELVISGERRRVDAAAAPRSRSLDPCAAVRLTRRRRAPTLRRASELSAIILLCGLTLAASGGAATATTSLAAAPSPKTVAPSQVAFSLALLRNLVGTTGSNLVVSPSSLEVSLSMLELGAKGATEDGIARALSAGSLSPSVLAASFGALRSSLESAKGTELAEADAIFAESGVTPHAPYLAQLRSDFAASLHVVDFEANATEATDVSTTSSTKATKGLIPVLFADPLGPTTKIVLADAVYLHANWETPFPHGATAPAEFHEQSGSTESVPFMNGTVAASYLIRPGLTAVQLPYKGGRLAALVLEPTSGSVANFVSSLLPSTLSSALVALRTASVELSMPKVSLNSAENLNGPLTSLGMGDALLERSRPSERHRGPSATQGLDRPSAGDAAHRRSRHHRRSRDGNRHRPDRGRGASRRDRSRPTVRVPRAGHQHQAWCCSKRWSSIPEAQVTAGELASTSAPRAPASKRANADRFERSTSK